MLPIIRQYKNLLKALVLSEFASYGTPDKAPGERTTPRAHDSANKALADAIESREVTDKKTKLDPGLQKRLLNFIKFHTNESHALNGTYIKPETIAQYKETDPNTARILQKLYDISKANPGSFEKGIVKFLEEWMSVKADAIEGRRVLRADLKKERRVAPVVDGRSEDGLELVGNLQQINYFLSAFNNTYGERTNIFSNKNGIVGMLWQMADPDINKLRRQLNIDEGQLVGILQEMGVPTTRGEALTGPLIRFATIAALGLILSGGTTAALTIFEVNIGREQRLGPDARRILQALGETNTNLTAKFRKLLTSKKTTTADIDAVFDVLNEEAMMPNNLRNFAKELYDVWPMFEWLHSIFPTQFGKVKGLINELQNQGTSIERGEEILREIYAICLEQYRSSNTELIQTEKEVGTIKSAIAAGRTPYIPNTGNDRNEISPREYLMQKERELRKSSKETSRLGQVLGRIGTEVSRVTQLNAKKISVGPERQKKVEEQRYLREVGLFEEGIGRRYRRPGEQVNSIKVSKIDTPQSYAPKLPTPLNYETLSARMKFMMENRVGNDKYSMAANLMRGVEYHYGISFNSEEFVNAFLQMRYLDAGEKAIFNKTVLSNTGRQLEQRFQGKPITEKVAVMNLNGTKVYFKEGCTNVVTVVEDMPTTIEMARSFPIVLGISTPGLRNLVTGREVVGSKPIDGGVIDLPPTIPGQPVI